MPTIETLIGQTSWSKALVRHGADARTALAKVLGWLPGKLVRDSPIRLNGLRAAPSDPRRRLVPPVMATMDGNLNGWKLDVGVKLLIQEPEPPKEAAADNARSGLTPDSG
jgi:hypothetical protein